MCFPTSAWRGLTLQLWTLNPAKCSSLGPGCCLPPTSRGFSREGLWKETPSSSCDLPRAHLPLQCQQGPTLWKGEGQMCSTKYQGRLTWPPCQVARISVRLRGLVLRTLQRYLTKQKSPGETWEPLGPPTFQGLFIRILPSLWGAPLDQNWAWASVLNSPTPPPQPTHTHPSLTRNARPCRDGGWE